MRHKEKKKDIKMTNEKGNYKLGNSKHMMNTCNTLRVRSTHPMIK